MRIDKPKKQAGKKKETAEGGREQPLRRGASWVGKEEEQHGKRVTMSYNERGASKTC